MFENTRKHSIFEKPKWSESANSDILKIIPTILQYTAKPYLYFQMAFLPF